MLTIFAYAILIAAVSLLAMPADMLDRLMGYTR